MINLLFCDLQLSLRLGEPIVMLFPPRSIGNEGAPYNLQISVVFVSFVNIFCFQIVHKLTIK